MPIRYSRGETARLFFDYIDAGEPQTGRMVTVALQRVQDGKWLQAVDSTWRPTPVDNALEELDAAFLPGRYYFDFDQKLDELPQSTKYIAKFIYPGPSVGYEDLVFGPITNSAAPDLCAVQGTIFGAQSTPLANQVVRATLIPVLTRLGRGVGSDQTILTHTNNQGDFSLALVQTGTFRLEIPSIGFDRKVVIPEEASVLFTDL